MLIQEVEEVYVVPLREIDQVVPVGRAGALNATTPGGAPTSTSDVKLSWIPVSRGETNGFGPTGVPKYSHPGSEEVAEMSERVCAPGATSETVTEEVADAEYGVESRLTSNCDEVGRPEAEIVTFALKFSGESPSHTVSLTGPSIVIVPDEIGQSGPYESKQYGPWTAPVYDPSPSPVQ